MYRKEDFHRLIEATLQRSGAAVHDYASVLWFVLDPQEGGFINQEAFHDIVELMGMPYCDIYK